MIRSIFALTMCFLMTKAHAELKVVFEDIDIHYIVLSTMSLDPEVAAKYGIPRAPLKGFVNISAVSNKPPYTALATEASVEVKNLLGQIETIALKEIQELPARYSVGTFSFSPEETMRFRFHVRFADGREQSFEHQQQMFVEE